MNSIKHGTFLPQVSIHLTYFIISKFDMFDYWDVLILIKKCLSTFLKTQIFSKNTDQIQNNFRGFPDKVCITDQNYLYRPVCHHCNTGDSKRFKGTCCGSNQML